MKILIVECEKNLGDHNTLKECVMPIFNQGHDVHICTKENVYKELDAHILMTSDEAISLPEIVKLLFFRISAGEHIPEFLGLVSKLKSDSLNRALSGKLREKVSIGWKTFSPERSKKNGMIDWPSIFDSLVKHFELVYTVSEFEMHLPKWFHENWEEFENSSPVQNLLKEIRELSSYEGISDSEGNKYLSNDQWIEYREKFIKIVEPPH